jgi:hypothetical protein
MDQSAGLDTNQEDGQGNKSDTGLEMNLRPAKR